MWCTTTTPARWRSSLEGRPRRRSWRSRTRADEVGFYTRGRNSSWPWSGPFEARREPHRRLSLGQLLGSAEHGPEKWVMPRTGEGLGGFLPCKMTGEPVSVSRVLPEDVRLLGQSMEFITQSSEGSWNVLSLTWCPSPHSYRVTGRGPRKTYPRSGLYYRRALSSGD